MPTFSVGDVVLYCPTEPANKKMWGAIGVIKDNNCQEHRQAFPDLDLKVWWVATPYLLKNSNEWTCIPSRECHKLGHVDG